MELLTPTDILSARFFRKGHSQSVSIGLFVNSQPVLLRLGPSNSGYLPRGPEEARQKRKQVASKLLR